MEINESDKITILLASLQERYAATHNIRARVEQICTWSLGILVVVAGFFIDRDISLSIVQKIFAISALAAILIVLRFFFLRDLEKGFRGQFKTATRIEKILKLYDENEYTESSVYPKEWERAGQVKCDGRFFRSSYLLLYVGFVILIGSIIIA